MVTPINLYSPFCAITSASVNKSIIQAFCDQVFLEQPQLILSCSLFARLRGIPLENGPTGGCCECGDLLGE